MPPARTTSKQEDKAALVPCPDGQRVCTRCLQPHPLSAFACPPRSQLCKTCATCRAHKRARALNSGTVLAKRLVFYRAVKAHFMFGGCSVPGCRHNHMGSVHMQKHGEFDHLGKKRFGMTTWSRRAREFTETDLLDERNTCRPLCSFHHRLHSYQQQRRKSKHAPSALYRLNCAKKREQACCAICQRPVEPGNEVAFDWDHLDPLTKYTTSGGRRLDVSQLIRDGYSWRQAVEPETRKCQLLCSCCHREQPSSNNKFD